MTLLRIAVLATGLLLSAACAPAAPVDPVAEVLELAPRPVYGRVMGSAGHAPCELVDRPGRTLPLPVCRRAPSLEASDLPGWLRAPANAQETRAAILWRLSWSTTPEVLDRTITALDELTRSTTTPSAEVWNDLSVAYLERGYQRDDPMDLLAALAANQRITEERPETLFNRALLLEGLGFTRVARGAWERYLEVETDPGWSQEARQHLEALRTPERPSPNNPGGPLEARLAEIRAMLWSHELEQAREAVERLRAQVAPGTPQEAELHLADCEIEYQGTRYELAMARVDAAEASLGDLPEPVLRARIWRWRGLFDAVGGEHFAALHAYATARRLFVEAGDVAGDLNACRAQADTLRLMGDLEASWRVLLPCLRSEAPQSAAAEYALLEIAHAGLPGELRIGAGEVVLQEMLRLAGEVANPVYWSSALLASARARLKGGEAAAASSELARAEEAIANIGDAEVRQVKECDLRIAEAEILAATDPVAALPAFDRALTMVNDTEYEVAAPAVLAGRAAVLRRLGRPEEAHRDLDAALVRLEAVARSKISGEIHVAFAEQVRDLYAERLEIGLTAGESPEALLGIADRARLVLLQRSPTPKRLRPAPGTAVVAYFVLSESLLVWYLDGEALELRQKPLASADLGRQVDDWLAAIGRGDPSAASGAATLGELLLGDLWERLAGQQRVVFVPDGPLHRVPFAALRGGTPQHFLIEHLEVGTTPAASLLGEGAVDGTPVSSVLVVAANEPGGSMPHLPAALREGHAVKAVWSERATLVAAREATPDRLLELAPGSEVLHIAAHGRGNPDAPFTASLVMAATPQGGSAYLPVTRLLEQSFPRTRLVVLSACRTAEGGTSAATGAVSLASGFLMAGVPEAVATLWEVQDDRASDLASRLHEHLRAGRSPASALRAVQVEALRSAAGDPSALRHWAAYQHLQASR